MVEHFHVHVAGNKGKIGGKARAMVVTSSIDGALEYYTAINGHLQARQSPCKAIVAGNTGATPRPQRMPLGLVRLNKSNPLIPWNNFVHDV